DTVNRKIILLLFISTTLLIAACVKKIESVEVNYQGTLAFPLAEIGFQVSDLLDEDSALVADNQNGVRLVHESALAEITAAQLLNHITEPLKGSGHYEKTVQEISLPDYSAEATTNFGTALTYFSDPALQQFFQNNDGQSLPIPAFSMPVNMSLSPMPFADFENLEIKSGTVTATLTNGFFFDLENFSVMVRDETTGQDVGTLFFGNIPAGQSQTAEFPLANTTIGNAFSFVIPQIATPGTSAATIDLSAEMKVQVTFRDIQIDGGNVRLDGSQIIRDTVLVDFTAQNGSELTQMELETGLLNYAMQSDFSENIKVTMTFPSVLKNGNPLNVSMTLPPTGVNDSIVGVLDLSGTTILLDQDADQPFNRLRVIVKAQMDDPGNNLITFHGNEQIAFSFQMNAPKVRQVKGYFGQFDEIIEPGAVHLGFDFPFIDPTSEPVFFEDAQIELRYENAFGVPARAEFDMVSSGILNPDQELDPPSIDLATPDISMIGQAVQGSAVIDHTNSNIVSFLSIFPNQILYEGLLSVNPDGQAASPNFLTKDDYFAVAGRFELPFRLSMKNLIYRDTLDAFNFDLGEGITIEDIREGELKFSYENTLPVDLNARLTVLDAAGNESPILDDFAIPAASVNADGVVEPGMSATGEIFIPISQNQIRDLDEATQNIVEFRFQSYNQGNTPVVLLTHSGVQIKTGVKVFLDTQ
ncbi:MAG: hypothetical protein D6714_07805, partial [Bacteroidetes bacterium]